MGGVWGLSALRRQSSLISKPLSPFFSYPCALFCTFLYLRRSHLFSFHGLRTLRQETGGWGGTPAGCLGMRRGSCSQHAVVPSRYRKTRYMHLKLLAERCCLFFRSFWITDF